ASGNKLPPGTYSIAATVSTPTGSTAAQTEVASQVTSVTLNGSSGLMLNLKGVGAVPFSQVTQII
ncbi:FLgD tudor-like domain-containing protein, partial [Acinetobacter baumannii]